MKVLDLFCGAGGFSTGFIDAGFDVVAGIDIWNIAIDTYNTNHLNSSGLVKDLVNYTPQNFVDETGIQNIDIIIGGIPCQSFSMGGKRDIDDPRHTLFMEYLKFVDFFNPKAFVIENVIGILSMKNGGGEKYIDIIIDVFSKKYNTTICKLYASDFEVPQNRRRVIIYGIRNDLNIIPTSPSPLYPIESRPQVSSILLDKNEVSETLFLSEKAICGINRRKSENEKEGKGFGAQFLDLNKPSFTIPARYYKDGYDALIKYNDNEIRRLEIIELSRIQSFPDNYIFCGNRKDKIMQIGNAVPVKFAYHIAKHLKQLLENKCENNDNNKCDDNNEYTSINFQEMTVPSLIAYCKENNIRGYSRKTKQQIIELINKFV